MAQRTLRITRDEARSLLKQQIEKGEALLSRQIHNEDDLAKYVDDRLRFNQFNCQMLERMFGEVINSFWRFGFSSPSEYEDWENKVQFYRKLDGEQVNELRGLVESLKLIPRSPMNSKKAEQPSVPDFGKIGLKWLFEHLPVKIWLGLVTAALSLLPVGIYLGQISVVQEFFEKKPPIAQTAPTLTSEELKSRVDQTTKAHNERRNNLIAAIIKEEHHATEPMPRTYEIERTLERLRKELEKEDAAYENELRLLNSLGKQ